MKECCSLKEFQLQTKEEGQIGLGSGWARCAANPIASPPLWFLLSSFGILIFSNKPNKPLHANRNPNQ
ncbi:hypothetical protein VNO78_01736 [Psophocarpus tetragonolobus]|uniref:Uncharacterized protein n=1 Tax=Psophocarpus tetragonolobus TaxID=3891 RepID=A0AAN9T209_PSOTE